MDHTDDERWIVELVQSLELLDEEARRRRRDLAAVRLLARLEPPPPADLEQLAALDQASGRGSEDSGRTLVGVDRPPPVR